MTRAKRLYLLLAVLAAVCLAAFLALRMETRREQIANSGETVLAIDPESVQSLSWTYEGDTLSFHKDGTWLYDDDEAFPVDEEKIQELLELFENFGAAFIITDVEDDSQYGLDDPTCTITLTTEETSYEIQLGDYSEMDAQRYVSTGDGNVYLAASDPLGSFSITLRDLIKNDEVPGFGQVTELTFSGAEEYSIFYAEDSTVSYSDDDRYFTQRGGTTVPMDTAGVESYIDSISYVELNNYVTYNADDEDLQTYGLDDPELTVSVDYSYETTDGEEVSDTFVLQISRDPQERSSAAEEEDAEITAYARVADSSIIYQLSSDDYTALMAASYDELRHQEVFWGDFEEIEQIDISLEGETYTITAQGKGDNRTYLYQEEVEFTDFQSAVEALQADVFTDEEPTQQEEISLTIHLNNENFPTVQIALYRYDGTNCLAVVDGEPVSLVPRSEVVDLTEAVRAIVLN